MDVDVERRVNVIPVLRATAAGLFLLVVFLTNPGGQDGVIATAGVYGLVETTFAAAATRAVLPNLTRFATLTLATLVVGVGILPMLTPGTAAIIIPSALALWLFVVCMVLIRSNERRRQIAAFAGLLCAAAAVVSIVFAPAMELRLLAITACICSLALWRFSPPSLTTDESGTRAGRLL
jgi:hypothetical protein